MYCRGFLRCPNIMNSLRMGAYQIHLRTAPYQRKSVCSGHGDEWRDVSTLVSFLSTSSSDTHHLFQAPLQKPPSWSPCFQWGLFQIHFHSTDRQRHAFLKKGNLTMSLPHLTTAVAPWWASMAFYAAQRPFLTCVPHCHHCVFLYLSACLPCSLMPLHMMFLLPGMPSYFIRL